MEKKQQADGLEWALWVALVAVGAALAYRCSAIELPVVMLPFIKVAALAGVALVLVTALGVTAESVTVCMMSAKAIPALFAIAALALVVGLALSKINEVFSRLTSIIML